MTQNPNDALLRKIFAETKTLACVGVSMNPIRPSYFVARYLSLKNFRVIPVNPGHAGESLFGEEIYADIASIPKDIKIDMVDIFRRSEHVPPIVAQAITHRPDLKTIWMQIGVVNAEADEMATKAGLQVIENRCPKIEYQRLFGELRMGGFNTGIISSKL
jgi:predicted CoA-binding protein